MSCLYHTKWYILIFVHCNIIKNYVNYLFSVVTVNVPYSPYQSLPCTLRSIYNVLGAVVDTWHKYFPQSHIKDLQKPWEENSYVKMGLFSKYSNFISPGKYNSNIIQLRLLKLLFMKSCVTILEFIIIELSLRYNIWITSVV